MSAARILYAARPQLLVKGTSSASRAVGDPLSGSLDGPRPRMKSAQYAPSAELMLKSPKAAKGFPEDTEEIAKLAKLPRLSYFVFDAELYRTRVVLAPRDSLNSRRGDVGHDEGVLKELLR